MTAQRMLNCGLEAVCLLVCLELLVHQLMIKSRHGMDRWLQIALVANIGMIIGDITDWMLSGRQESWVTPVFTAGMVTYFVMSGVLIFSLVMYFYCYMGEKAKLSPKLLRIAAAASFFQIFLGIISPFCGIMYSISPQNTYVRGPLFWATQVDSIITAGLAIYILVNSWRLLSKKEKIYFSFYILIPAVSEFIQALVHNMALLNVSLTMNFLLANLFIDSEIDEQLHISSRKLEEERTEALRSQQIHHERLIGETIIALSNAVEAKDRYTNGHSQRVAQYAKEIARRMGWSPEEQRRIYYAGLLHDVGKIRVPDSIINKNTRLDPEEYEEIKIHALAGYYILKEISSISDFAISARWHHERYDGTGYPNGLSGENIPLIARVISVADAYDAMTSNRSYRNVLSQEKVKSEIEKGMGTQFDPDIAKIMLDIIEEDREYRKRQPDEINEKVILAIDDDPMVLRLLELILKRESKYHLITASSGHEGINILGTEAVDLVLLDVEMQGINGFDVLEWIRKRGLMTPVIFMTGDKEMEIIQRAEQMGVNDYLTKPLVARMLIESVENVLWSTRRIF